MTTSTITRCPSPTRTLTKSGLTQIPNMRRSSGFPHLKNIIKKRVSQAFRFRSHPDNKHGSTTAPEPRFEKISGRKLPSPFESQLPSSNSSAIHWIEGCAYSSNSQLLHKQQTDDDIDAGSVLAFRPQKRDSAIDLDGSYCSKEPTEAWWTAYSAQNTPVASTLATSIAAGQKRRASKFLEHLEEAGDMPYGR